MIFAFWQGGLTIHGAVIGSILVGIWYSHWKKVSFWKLADTIAPSLALGQFIGRLGCFLNGCCYGVSTELPWGVKFNSPSSLIPYAMLGKKVHPTQLYESALNFIV